MKRIEVNEKIYNNIEMYIEQYERETGENVEVFLDNLYYIEMDNRGVTFVSEAWKDEYISDSVKELYNKYGLFRDYINNLFK